jgi:predicted dehydrogenase
MIRCALIGCGRAAAEFHLPALLAIPEVSVVALCDPQEVCRQRLAARISHRVRQYAHVDDLLAAEKELSFATIATPGFTHSAVARAVLAAGVPALIEKPLALSLADGRTLAALAKERGVRASVIHNYRYLNATQQARQALEGGLLGEVYQVTTVYHGEPLFQEESEWMWKEREHRVLLYEYGTHFIDLAVWFAGPVTAVRGLRSHWDNHLQCTKRIHALLEHAGGATSFVDLQLFSSSNFSQMEVYGTANDALLRFFPDSCRVYSGHVSAVDELAEGVKRLARGAWTLLGDQWGRQAVPSRARGHLRLFQQFVRALQDPSVRPPVPLEEALATLEAQEILSRSVYGENP